MGPVPPARRRAGRVPAADRRVHGQDRRRPVQPGAARQRRAGRHVPVVAVRQPRRAHRPPADGITFFLVDGAADLTRPGAFGGSLGYAAKYDFRHLLFGPGVVGGYLGIGLDVVGNYFPLTPSSAARAARRASGRPRDGRRTTPRTGSGDPTWSPSAGRRFPRATGARYCRFLAATTTCSHRAKHGGEPFESTLPGSLQGSCSFTEPVTPAEAGRRTSNRTPGPSMSC